MAQIASLKDFRGQGAPADVGTFQVATTALVFQFTFSGTLYTVAMASGVGGWTLIDQLPAGTDDVVINSAIAHVGGAAIGGGETLVLGGRYNITAPITDHGIPELTLRGVGHNTYFFLVDGADCNVINITLSSYWDLRDFRVNANRDNQTVDNNGIYFNDVDHSLIDNVEVFNARRVAGALGEGIRLFDSNYNTITNCTTESCDYDGIKLWTSNWNIVENNTSRNNAENQIQCAYSAWNIVIGNTCINTGEGVHGILVAHGGADGNIIIGNMLYDFSHALRVNAVDGVCSNTTFIGNHIYSASRGANISGGGAEHALETFLIGNYFHDCGTAIRLELADYSFVTENYISGATTAVIIDAGSTSNRFGEHYIFNTATIVTDNGTDTQFPSESVPMGVMGGGATDGTLGVLINAAGQWVVGSVEIKWAAHALVKVCVEAVCNQVEADAMRAELRIWAGNCTLGESFNAHGETVTPILTENTDLAINEMIRWSRTSAAITAMKGGDNLSVRILGLALLAPNAKTHAHVRTLTYHYL